MNKAELEQKILEATKKVPSTYGEYKILHELRIAIGRVMGYRIIHFKNRTSSVVSNDYDILKSAKINDDITKIIRGMEAKGYIKFSKSGQAYKVLY